MSPRTYSTSFPSGAPHDSFAGICASPLAACLLAALSMCVNVGWAGAPAPVAATQPTSEIDLSSTSLRARVQPAHEESLRAFSATGQRAQVHQLSDRECALVERALDALPALHRQILQRRLARLSFVDAPWSPGTALTRGYDGADGKPLFDITVRGDVLDTSLSDFLTDKDVRLFTADASGYRLQLDAGALPALEYLLLHEATHVVDNTLKITADGGPFREIWTDYRSLAASLDRDPVAHSVYRRAPAQPLSQAPALYRALAESPFVSLYSTASAGEDFAELIAWRELSQRLDVGLTIWIRDSSGNVVARFDPLSSTSVQARMAKANAVLQQVEQP
ncbi:hypothetical protein M0D45_00275 [Xanthomonas prunicola]|uniref:hypothetical protein n=1 Tax=Xanthomonas prunicola TaxID=2053930 RepID=UPI0021B3EAF6|nr:hypothetical protein [Xanthomonas prunicola]UXA53285.1 hypothetical protein M0D45_00275 [Xanthomonas prunicola]